MARLEALTRWTPFEEAYPNANPLVIQVVIQFRGKPTPREQTILMSQLGKRLVVPEHLEVAVC